MQIWNKDCKHFQEQELCFFSSYFLEIKILGSKVKFLHLANFLSPKKVKMMLFISVYTYYYIYSSEA